MNTRNSSSNLPIIRLDPIDGLSTLLQPYGHIKTFLPGFVLFRQLEEIHSLYVIKSGLIELAILSKTGDKKVIAYCYEGVIIGEMGLYQRYFNSSQATILKKSTLNVIPIGINVRKILKDPKIVTLLNKSLIIKLQLITNQFGVMMLESTIAKISSVLLDFNSQEVRLTQEKLADSVGCSRVTITRHLGFLENQGIIKNKRGRIVILNKKALKELI